MNRLHVAGIQPKPGQARRLLKPGQKTTIELNDPLEVNALSEICKRLSQGLTFDEAATLAHCSPRRFARIRMMIRQLLDDLEAEDRKPTGLKELALIRVHEQITLARAEIKTRQIKRIDQAGETDWKAAAHLLDRVERHQGIGGQSADHVQAITNQLIMINTNLAIDPKTGLIEHSEVKKLPLSIAKNSEALSYSLTPAPSSGEGESIHIPAGHGK